MSMTTSASASTTPAREQARPDQAPPGGKPVAAAHRRARPFSDPRVTILQALVGLTFLGIWQAASAFRLINPIFFSDPIAIIRRVWTFASGEAVYSRTIYDHLRVTLQEMAVGYVIGAAIGMTLGFALARSRTASRILEPYILAIYSVPKIALAPLFILFLGIGLESKVGVVVMEVFFLVFFNTFAGVRGVNEEHVQLARIMGASGASVTRRIIIPSAMPSIMIGLKMGVPFAMIGAIIGEFIASTQGLGWLILYSSSNFDASGLFASIGFLVAVVWTLGQVVAFFENRLLRWRPTQEREVVQV